MKYRSGGFMSVDREEAIKKNWELMKRITKGTENMDTEHHLIQFFSYEHLPEAMKNVSKPFCDLAKTIDLELRDNPEKTTALRKLLEAKDCAVRAVIYK